MKILNKTFLFAFLLLISANVLIGQKRMIEAWSDVYNGRDSLSDIPLAMDAHGCIYVAGVTQSASDVADFVIIRYSKDGTRLWSKTYGKENTTDYAIDIVVDPLCNLYVAGYSLDGLTNKSEIIILKYDKEGNVLWERKYSNPSNVFNSASKIRLDGSGNVYVLGVVIKDQLYIEDLILLKYNSSGVFQWERNYDGVNDRVALTSMALDQNGNIYLGGRHTAKNNFQSNFLVVKFSGNGQRLWSNFYNGPGNGEDVVNSICTDNSGNLYVTGSSQGSGTNSDYATLKYSSQGSLVWIHRYNGTGNYIDNPVKIVANNNYIYVTGTSYNGIGFTKQDIVTIKYQLNGKVEWVNRYDGPLHLIDSPSDFLVDGLGNIFIAANQQQVSEEVNVDLVLIHIDPKGGFVSLANFRGEGDAKNDAGNFTYEFSGKIVMDNNGSVYVTGGLFTEERSHDIVTIKYEFLDPLKDGISLLDGILWFRNQNIFNATIDALNFASDRDDNIFEKFEKQFKGYSSLRKRLVFIEDSLVNVGSFDENNDPDNHFIPDNLLRTVFNQNLEIRIGLSFYKFIDSTRLVQIPDGDISVLNRLRTGDTSILNNNPKIIVYNLTTATPASSCEDFYYNVTSGTTVEFAPAYESTLCSYYWDFGDGSPISKDMNVVHTYSNSGNYIVTLSFYCPAGCDGTVTKLISIPPIPTCPSLVADFEFTDLGSAVFKFTSTSSGAPTNFWWTFGDGNSTVGPSEVTYTYLKPKIYNVKLTITKDGCSSSITKQVTNNFATCCENFNFAWIIYYEYVSGERKMKAKIWRANIIKIYDRVGGTTINYKKVKKRKRSVWRRTKDYIFTEVDGSVFIYEKYYKKCDEDLKKKVFVSKSKDNGSIVEISAPVRSKFSTKQKSVKSTHKVRYKNNTYEKNLYLSTPCN